MNPGTRLGPYEVVGPLGSGGMGEVWKARDTRLERSVAIKILPGEFAQNAQLKLRFEREAKAISQLSHPNICTLYDVGDGYLVMELLDGETLADRIARGPLPIGDVVKIGAQIGDALDRAHKAGIVHRDLKPGNVMLTKSGAKLLDFGLAKGGAPLPGSSLSSQLGMTAQKPLTEEGTLLGTFQYMAPEQLEGAEADARTDLFALGAVLYEMATGKRAFDGKSKASLIASILAAEPKPVSAVQPMAPARFDRIVRKCLEKDPDQRWQSAHDVATELRWLEDTQEVLPPPERARLARVAWGVAATLAIVAIAAGAILWRNLVEQRNAPVVRTLILPPEKAAFDFGAFGAPPALSPDGRRIVFGAAETGKPRSLWVRPLDSFVAQPLAGTEGASYPFWSPDGQFIAFFADNLLKKMDVSGGAPVVLCSAPDGRGGSWSPDGRTIVFAGRYTPVFRVAPAGGPPVEVTKLDQHVATHRWPEFLPDSRHFLYLASANGNEDAANAIVVGSIDGQTRKPLVTAANEPHYLDGYLLFTRDRILTAQRFDVKRLDVTGDAFPLKEPQIEEASLMSRSVVSIAPTGTLIYQAGSAKQPSQLTWFDRTGKPLGSIGVPAAYTGVVVAPDEKTILTSVSASTPSNIWSIDIARGVKSRVTFNNNVDTNPIWSPDGQKLIYSSFDAGRFRLVLRDLSAGSDETLLQGQAPGTPAVTSWSPAGVIFYVIVGQNTLADLWWMSLADRKPHPYLVTPFIESVPRLSSDGKWVAYQSNETGTNEIYIAPFPPTGAKWQVSTEGGIVPRWRADGKELFYIVPGNPSKFTAVSVALGTSPRIGPAVKLFETAIGQPGVNVYDVSRDGQKLIVNMRVGEAAAPAPLSVVQHFDHELRSALEHR